MEDSQTGGPGQGSAPVRKGKGKGKGKAGGNSAAAAAGGVVHLNFAGVILNGAGTIKGQVTVVASTLAGKSQVQNVTLTVPSGGTGITIPSGVVFVQVGTTTGATVNGGNATSTGILVQGSALIENSMILGQNVDISVNGGMCIAGDLPFGGYKASGIGREWGLEGIEEFLQSKVVAWRI